MYSTLLVFHSLIRWLVLVFILYSIYRAFVGLVNDRAFSKTDNAFRHWTATVAHIQLMIGIILYTKSPLVKYFWKEKENSFQNLELIFYGLIHIILMLTAIVVVTIGSAKAKRQQTNKKKFKTMLVWFSIALIIIFIAIPWPFLPFSGRPYFRIF